MVPPAYFTRCQMDKHQIECLCANLFGVLLLCISAWTYYTVVM